MFRTGVKLGLATPALAARRYFTTSSCFSSSKYIQAKPSKFTNDIPVEYGNTYEFSDQEEVEEHYTKSTWYIFATRSFAAVLCIHALFHLYAYSQGVFDEDVSKVCVFGSQNGALFVESGRDYCHTSAYSWVEYPPILTRF